MPKINYITHDAWWNSDLPLLPKINKYFRIRAFIFSSVYYEKHFKVKESPYVEGIYEYERKYRLKNFLSAYSAFKFYKGVRSTYEKGDILFYVFGDDPYFNLYFLIFAMSKKTIISFHNYRAHSGTPFLERFFKRIYLKWFKAFHFQSEPQYEQFCLNHGSKNAFFTDMPSKDFGKPGGRIQLAKNNKRIFLFFGYIRDYKRLDLFIEAANNSIDSAHFVIAGNCQAWSQYESQIINKKKFTCNINFIDNSEIADYFTQAHFLVLPYSDTTQSGPFHIANYYNLPIIASDVLGFREIITDGRNGFLFKQGDAKDLERCINTACVLSDREYSTLKENQQEMEKQYSLKANAIGEKFKSFIDQHLG
ncbi:MAG: glycosyltransferase family 4 protein [Ferruginibacter sp.]